MMDRPPKLFLLAALTLAIGFSAIEAEARVSQFHARLGAMAGSYDGPQSGTFQVPSTLDLEYETFFKNKQSYAFRALMALELPASKPLYTYFGTGWRYYFTGKGPKFERSNNQVYFVSSPVSQIYFAADVGVSQVIIDSFGDVLQIIGSMFELGVGLGVNRHITRDFSVQARVGISTGYGFTSVGLLGVTGQALVGAAYYF